MKVLNPVWRARLGVLALCSALLMGAQASAQSNINTNANANVGGTTRTIERDDDTDYGWLGLLGLAGLAGLLRKPRQVEVHDNRTANR